MIQAFCIRLTGISIPDPTIESPYEFALPLDISSARNGEG